MSYELPDPQRDEELVPSCSPAKSGPGQIAAKCQECGAVQWGNANCPTCRSHWPDGRSLSLRPWCECDPEYEGRCPDPCALDTIGKTGAEESSAARVPTERQFQTLMSLGSGSALLTGTKRTVEPLLRHGWVTCDPGWSWTRITAEGLHALARGVAKYGLPEMTHGSYHEKACSECGRKWRPKCRCGSTRYRFESREVERAAAEA